MSRIVTDEQIETFLETCRSIAHKPYESGEYVGERPTFKAMIGAKYARIVRCLRNGESAHCFIDLDTGDVLKADGWKRPAKKPRGNLFDDDGGAYGLTEHGARYLR
jgi:hypothetical protein